MESRVWQPGAAQVRPPPIVGEGGGILPGRLPFIDPLSAKRLLRLSYFSHGRRCGFSPRAKKIVEKA